MAEPQSCSIGMPQAPTVNYCIKLLNTLSYILTRSLNIVLIWSILLLSQVAAMSRCII